jgi:NADH:ubiquinone oxidoreductase subunit E
MEKKLLNMIKEAQAKEGYVSEDAMTQIAQDLKLPLGEVYGVTTFYSFLSTQPWGAM